MGADQLMASLVLEQQGTLEVVLPFPDYRTRFADEQDAKRYDNLLSRASHIEVLQPQASDEERRTWRRDNGSLIAAPKCLPCGMVSPPQMLVEPPISCATRWTSAV